jgi:hypothetical protein
MVKEVRVAVEVKCTTQVSGAQFIPALRGIVKLQMQLLHPCVAGEAGGVAVLTAACTLCMQEYYQVIYAGSEAFIRYHKEHSNDPNACVSPWAPDGRRTISFGMALNIPQMLKKAIGVCRLQHSSPWKVVNNLSI